MNKSLTNQTVDATIINPSLLILQMMLTLSYESSLTEVDKSSTVDN